MEDVQTDPRLFPEVTARDDSRRAPAEPRSEEFQDRAESVCPGVR